MSVSGRYVAPEEVLNSTMELLLIRERARMEITAFLDDAEAVIAVVSYTHVQTIIDIHKIQSNPLALHYLSNHNHRFLASGSLPLGLLIEYQTYQF